MESINIVDRARRPDEGVFGCPAVEDQLVARGSPRDHWKNSEPHDGIVPDIAGVSETMLWSLYNRASEARRADGILVDPNSVHIHAAIDYDFVRRFGDPQGSLAARAAEIDRALRSWIELHPEGTVVSLGEGLETQARRVDNGRMRWLSVDLPSAIRMRERFLAPTDRFRHIAVNALDPVWMDAVDPSYGVFIVAQGLLMYLAPERVRQLFVIIADRFPGVELVFDAIPRWFSNLTVQGLKQTASYRLPSMPWGINRDEVEPTLRRWHAYVGTVTLLSYRSPRGLPHLIAGILNLIPVARHAIPCLVYVTIADAGQSAMPRAVNGEIASSAVGERNTLHVTPFRELNMTSINDSDTTADTIGDLLAAAKQTARCGGDIALAAGHVIAKRVALGMAATLNPQGADRAEFSRMVPEKVEAFSASGMIILKQSGHVNRQMMCFVSREMMTAARATIEMSGCRNPAALAEAQSIFARAWFSRLTSSWIALGLRIFEAQSAAMTPIRQTVIGNAERLARQQVAPPIINVTGNKCYAGARAI